MNEPTLILDEGGIPILEQCEGVTMPADYSFKCVNNFVHCESPEYEDLQNLALGMSSHIEVLSKEIEHLREALEKCSGLAVGGLCQMTHGGTRAFCEDIKLHVADALKGGAV